MHMIGLANIPMIVLFGPTNSNKFAPKNNYTKILDSKKIYNTKDINKIQLTMSTMKFNKKKKTFD